MSEDYKQEQERLKGIHEVINEKMLNLKEKLGDLKTGVIDLRKTFWDDVTVNFDNPDDIEETFISIKQQAEVLAERERSHRQFYQEVQKLLRLKESAYFGRIDFREEGEKEATKIYIGVTSLLDENEENFLIYDWRAPISSLYYDYSPGEAEYETPTGPIKGEMELKRQYIIKGTQIQGMFDTGVTIGDTLLQEILGKQASTQMKSIVATIQREQNRIIRDEKSKYLIVQGVAGSGKTSAALQRIAYLLYRYRKTLTSENIILFSPNPLFNSYVATVLPELGEENMEQTTYQQYLLSRFPKNLQVEDPFDQLEYCLTAMDEEEYETRMKAIHYKSSFQFKEKIDRYVNQLSSDGMIFRNIIFRGKPLFTKEEIKSIFYSFDKSLSIPNRLQLTKEQLLKELRKIEQEELMNDWVMEKAELLDKEDYLTSYQTVERHFANEEFVDSQEEEAVLAQMVVERAFKPIRRAIKRLSFINMKAMYEQLFTTNNEEFDDWENICLLTRKSLQQNKINYEDATPYLYLQDQIEGRKVNTQIRHVFIDEAQDYSPFQFEYLRFIFPHAKMTILGDINQMIYAHSLSTGSILGIEMDGAEKIILTKSYRSTKQIVEFTKQMIPGGEQIEPFNREGTPPTVTEVKDSTTHRKLLIEKVKDLQKEGHGTIAIICKTREESEKAFEALKDDLPVRILQKDDNSFEKGIVILPVYLAKGIEFDAVVIYNASNEQFKEERDRYLIYTACTRAMHELHIFSLGKKTIFLPENTNKEKEVG